MPLIHPMRWCVCNPKANPPSATFNFKYEKLSSLWSRRNNSQKISNSSVDTSDDSNRSNLLVKCHDVSSVAQLDGPIVKQAEEPCGERHGQGIIFFLQHLQHSLSVWCSRDADEILFLENPETQS